MLAAANGTKTNMEAPIIIEVAKQVPALSVLCFVVYLFLGKLSVFMEILKSIHDRHALALHELMKEHLDARAQSREAIRDNTVAMRENTVAMSHLIETFHTAKPHHQRAA